MLFWLMVIMTVACTSEKQLPDRYDVVVVGGGASGVMAGIQSARLGAKTLIIEETTWLGGMLTSAGVSAIDGNYDLSSGLWEEFRQHIYDYYGGADSVKTGWVSHVMFEPQVGAALLQQMANQESLLEIKWESRIKKLERSHNKWELSLVDSSENSITAEVVIDATELGDLLPLVGASYEVGMDARATTAEEIAPEYANDVIQDMTYVAILERYEEKALIAKPEGYEPSHFYCTCAGICDQDKMGRKLWDCDHMMNYGRLPNDRFMINWPIDGNDYYLNAIEMSHEARKNAFDSAKWYTKCYIYYLQNELGFENYGIAKQVFPTSDGFPMIPYHRESRRVNGKVQFTINDLARPFDQSTQLYRTGIAVGDYPVDHHHRAYPNYDSLPDLHFYPVPSYTIPMGSLLPANTSHLIVAEKSISVTNLVNGTTRLQPVCLLIGQAAGTLAALAVQLQMAPDQVPVRKVQSALLASKAYLMPYADVPVDHPNWMAVQRVGATGLMKGEGKNVGWKNYTFFYPDSTLTITSAVEGMKERYAVKPEPPGEEELTLELALTFLLQAQGETIDKSGKLLMFNKIKDEWQAQGWGEIAMSSQLTRIQWTVLLDIMLDPFQIPINHDGAFAD